MISSAMPCSRAGPAARMGPNFYQLQAPNAKAVACLERDSVGQLTGNRMRYSKTAGYSSKTLLRMLRKPSNLWGPLMLRNSLLCQRLQLPGFSLTSYILVSLLLSFIPSLVHSPWMDFTLCILTSCSLSLNTPSSFGSPQDIPTTPRAWSPTPREHGTGGVTPQCPSEAERPA